MDHKPPFVIVGAVIGAPPFREPDAEQLGCVDLEWVTALDNQLGDVPYRSARSGPFSA